jgi:tetratricopeptide (TPR) repeat protein
MTRTLLASLCIILMAAAATAQEIPERFRPLAVHLEEEETFVDAVRGFDKLHTGVALTAQKAAAERKKVGDMEGHDRKMEEAHAAVALVREAYEWALGHYPNNARLHNYYGELLYDAYGDQMAALKAWHNATSMDSDLAGPHNNLGLHYCHSGRYELGFAEMEKALELDKKNPDYHFNMAQLMLIHTPQYAAWKGYSPKKVYKRAMKHSETAVENAPEDYDILEDYAVNFFAAERYEIEADWHDAARAWQAAREHARNDSEKFFTWLNEGRVWLRAGLPEKAVDPLVTAVSMMPDSEPALELLKRARDQVGSTGEPLEVNRDKPAEEKTD